MFKGFDLLSARNLILAAAGVLVLSVLGMCLSMLRPHDSGGLAGDSFGTRGGGYRGVFELLESLGVRVKRDLAPPKAGADGIGTFVMINPNPRLVAVGPKYLRALRGWVETGGRVVVTPSTSSDFLAISMGASEDEEQLDILEAFEIHDEVSVGEKSEDYVEKDFTAGADGGTTNSESGSDNSNLAVSGWGRRQELEPPDYIAVSGDGSLAAVAADVRQLAVPGEGFLTLRAEPDDLAGSLRLVGKDGKENLLVAVVRRGAGEIIVVAEPAILSNRLIAQADNSVLAAHLIAPKREAVVFDEFYHGLAVRGNPLYLLTRPGFAAATIGLLLVVGVSSWRAAVFLGPPLRDARPTRRDIGEYISAMSQFFSRGRGSRRFLVSEVRDGVLRQICHELKLPMDTVEVDTITTALARRDGRRAQRLSDTIRDVDTALAHAGDIPKASFLPVMQRLASCL
jgi:hypothetical protein